MSADGLERVLRIAEVACAAAMRAGAEFVDAAAEHGETRSVAVEKNAIKSSDARKWGAVSVRAFSRGATGWSSASGLSEETARQAGEQAAGLARAAEPDPDFVDLVGPADYAAVAGLFDPRLAEVAGPQIADWITQNIDAARGVAADAVMSGGANVRWRQWALANNLGVRASQAPAIGRVNALGPSALVPSALGRVAQIRVCGAASLAIPCRQGRLLQEAKHPHQSLTPPPATLPTEGWCARSDFSSCPHLTLCPCAHPLTPARLTTFSSWLRLRAP